MKKIWTIVLLVFAIGILHAQQRCLPAYNNPVKQLPINDSVKIAYIEKGAGQTILFIHGLGGNLSHWEKCVDGLSENYHCIAVDLPGYGHSTDCSSNTPADFLQFYADVVIAFIKKMKLQNVVLAGHSMGGQIAVIVALQEPVMIKKLVLAAPAGFEVFSEQESKTLTTISTPAFFKNQDEAAIQSSFKRNFNEMADDVQQLIAFRIAMKQCAGFDNYCAAIANGIKGMLGHPVKQQLGLLSQQVLVIFGAEDLMIPNRYLHPAMTTLDVGREGASLIPKHTLEWLPLAGHILQYEKPLAFNKILINFLKSTNQ